jgi:hypothetical protein
MFLLPALAATASEGGWKRPRNHGKKVSWTPGFVVMSMLFIIMIGFRYKVGGDWYNYLEKLESVRYMALENVFTQTEIGYYLLNWVSIQLGLDIIGVNLVCALVFSLGLAYFCLSMPRPWLGMAVAVPYLVVVVGMGYSRQAVALGFEMLGLVALQRGSALSFAFWILIGATFHRTAILMLPIGALAATKNRLWSFIWVGVAAVVGFLTFIQKDVDSLKSTYIGGEMQSEGAFIRLAMNALPALLLVWLRKRINLSENVKKLWVIMSTISIVLFVLLFVVPSASTALDRIALYFLPIQIFIFSHMPDVIAGKDKSKRLLLVNAVVIYYAFVMAVWLNLGVWARLWVPYNSFLVQ